MKWPVKDPSDVLPYSIDWSRFLGTNTISSITWFIYDSDGTKTTISAPQTVNVLTVDSVAQSSTVATLTLSAGTAGVLYKIGCAMTDNASLTVERTVQLPVREL